MDDVDAELARLALWTLFAAASLTRPLNPIDPLAAGPSDRAAAEADRLLAIACERFPYLAEPAT